MGNNKASDNKFGLVSTLSENSENLEEVLKQAEEEQKAREGSASAEGRNGKLCFDGELDFGHLSFLTPSKDAYMGVLMELAGQGKDFAVTAADNTGKAVMLQFKKAYSDRFVDAGIAEANQVGMSAGIALSGKKVYLQGFGPFLALRCLDQVHSDIAYMNLPVCIVNTHGGVTSGGGPTHYNIMDLAIMRNLPNMTVVVPSDSNQMVKAVRASIDYPGPMFIRTARGAEPAVYVTQDYDYEIGKAVTVRGGDDCTIIAIGSSVAFACSAANGLEKEGINVRVIDMHTLKPLDKEAVIKAAKETGHIITAEDHLVVGGLGSAVAETLADAGIGCAFKRLGIPDDDFPSLGDPYELYAHYGYDAEGMKKSVREMLRVNA